jgi:hypothetical protein
MTSQATIQNSIARDRQTLSENALMYGDAEDYLRNCEEKLAILLKDSSDDAVYQILEGIETLKGIAGRAKLENE